jgi:1-acyl-sn-glycerol-3-phosphate acyltransferase
MFILRALMVVLSTIFFGSISLAISFFDPDGRRQNGVARAWARSLLWFGGVKVRVEGLECISTSRGYVIASNHASYMDTPVVLANIPLQFRFLAKRGLFKIPFLGNHLSRAGHIPVPREDPRAAVKTMTQAADIIRQRGISVLIFPEGGRSRHGELGAFKDGAAYIAIKAGAPILPIALIGTREVLPFGSGHIRPGEVTLKIGAPIETAGAALRDRGKITGQVHSVIAAMLDLRPAAEIPNRR